MRFSKKIIDWYLINKRDLPWRNTKDPYKIWLSEIILQQTRVSQGLPYYTTFVTNYPDVSDLANANEEDVLKLWQGLGYYSRARNLHFTAQYICNELNGVFPKKYDELLKLKGVGKYTAAAIASFSNDEPVAVVDGNVYRVLSRYFGIQDDISLSSSKKIFQEKAQENINLNQAANYNQAIMEFGAVICTPKNTQCTNCVLQNECVAYNTQNVTNLPVKTKKIKVATKFFNYLIIKDKKGNLIVNKRVEKGIWQNLYQFPLIESDSLKAFNAFNENSSNFLFNDRLPKSVVLKNDTIIKHKLSHQHLHINFYELTFDTVFKEAKPLKEIINLPFPVVVYNFIEMHYSN
jgi:A/G-specific adenine glycosylase